MLWQDAQIARGNMQIDLRSSGPLGSDQTDFNLSQGFGHGLPVEY